MPWRRMGEWRYSSTILDLGTRWRWVVSYTPRPLYPEEILPGTHWIGGWVGPRAGLDVVEKRKILALSGFEPRRSCPLPVTNIQCYVIASLSQLKRWVSRESRPALRIKRFILSWSETVKPVMQKKTSLGETKQRIAIVNLPWQNWSLSSSVNIQRTFLLNKP
jgi:hypothetical protein